MEVRQLVVKYKSKKLRNQCTQYNVAVKAYNLDMAKLIFMRISQLTAAENIQELIRYSVGRCHRLMGNRKNEYAMDLIHPFRLVFTEQDESVVTVRIEAIEDYH